MADQTKQLHATIHGKVHAVSFRYFTRRAAEQLGLTGWVRNRFNRTVEMVAEGEEGKLRELLDFVKRGPPSANVTLVDHTWEIGTGEFKKFKIRMSR